MQQCIEKHEDRDHPVFTQVPGTAALIILKKMIIL